jgi:hypothetical protein
MSCRSIPAGPIQIRAYQRWCRGPCFQHLGDATQIWPKGPDTTSMCKLPWRCHSASRVGMHSGWGAHAPGNSPQAGQHCTDRKAGEWKQIASFKALQNQQQVIVNTAIRMASVLLQLSYCTMARRKETGRGNWIDGNPKFVRKINVR